jgi:hypothetical protein
MGDWTVIISGGAGAVLGAAISFLSAYHSTKRQLAHQVLEAEKDRNFKLATEVYLKSAEASGRATFFLSTFADLGTKIEEKAKQQEGVAEAFMKVHLVAGLKTIIAQQEAQESFAEAGFKLSRLRVPIEILLSRVQSVEDETSSLSKTSDNIVQAIQALSQPPVSPESNLKRNALLERFQGIQERLQTLYEGKSRLLEAKTRLHHELAKDAYTQTQNYVAKLAQINIAVRQELGNTIDGARYAQVMTESQARLKIMLDSFLEDVRSIEQQARDGTLKFD